MSTFLFTLLAALTAVLIIREPRSLPVVSRTLLANAVSIMKPPPVIREITSGRTLQCSQGPGPGSLETGIFFGDTVDSAERMRDALARHESRFGTLPGLVKTYASLEDDFSEQGRQGQIVRTLLGSPGVTPLVSIEPTWHGSPREGLLDLLASGQADDRLARAAHGLADAGASTGGSRRPILVELAAEMNGRFGAPWQSEQNGGTTGPGAFVRAWRHIVDIVRAEGASNVRWVFAPSAGNPHTHHPTGPAHWAWYGHWYPGDGYVDFLGLHGFNHARDQGAWVPFVEIVTGDAADHMLNDMIARFPDRPVILGELGSSENPARPDAKGRWIEDAYRRMQACTGIAGAVWFDMNKEADWQIDSSESSANAYRAAVRNAAGGTGSSPGDSRAGQRLEK